jgi:hypothetical protein
MDMIVALAHLPAVDARHHRDLFADERLGAHQNLAIRLVELALQVLGDLDVLLLVLAHGDQLRLVDEDVGRHQHGIGEQPVVGRKPLGHLILVGMGPLKQPQRRDARQDPRQLRHFGHVGLAEKHGLGRIKTQRQVAHGHLPGVLDHQLGVVQAGERMVIRDEVEALMLGLHFDLRAHGPEVISQMQAAGRLNTR